MEWDTPAYVVIDMSAEIGAYQDEFEERAPGPAETVPPALVPLEAQRA